MARWRLRAIEFGKSANEDVMATEQLLEKIREKR